MADFPQDFVSGPYVWYWNGAALGIMNDAPVFRHINSSDTVEGDNLGDTIQAVIRRGGNSFVELTMQQFNLTAVRSAFWPYGPAHGTLSTGASAYESIGCRNNNNLLVAQKVDGSCAVPDRFYALNATVAPNFDLSYLVGSRLRSVALSLILLPWTDVAPASGAVAPATNPATIVTHVANDGELKTWTWGATP